MQDTDPTTSVTPIEASPDGAVETVDITPLPSDELRRCDRAFLEIMRLRPFDADDGPVQVAWADSRGLLSETLDTWGMGYVSPKILDIRLHSLEPGDLVRAGLIYSRRLTPFEAPEELDHKHSLDTDDKDRRRPLMGYRATLGGRMAIPLRDHHGVVRTWIGRLVDDKRSLRDVAGDYSPEEADPYQAGSEIAKYLNLGKGRWSRKVGGEEEKDRFPLTLSPGFIERCSGLVLSDTSDPHVELGKTAHDKLSDKETPVWVTEGHLDAVLASQAGVSSIAAGGCRTDPKQHLELVRLLSKFAAFHTPIYLCFDADEKRWEKNKDLEIGAGQRGMCALLAKIWAKNPRLARHIKVVLLKQPESGEKVDLADELKKVYDSIPKPIVSDDSAKEIVEGFVAKASWSDKVVAAQKAKLEELAKGAVESIDYLISQIPEGVRPRDRSSALEECGWTAVAAHDPDLWLEVGERVAEKLGFTTKSEARAWVKSVMKESAAEVRALERADPTDPLARYTDKDGTVRPAYKSVREILKLEFGTSLVWNEMTLKICVDDGLGSLRELEREDIGDLQDAIAEKHKCDCDRHKHLELALSDLALKRKVNPVNKWVKGLPEWDGVDRIPWLVKDVLGIVEGKDYTAEQVDLYGIYLRKWLMAAVARALKPGEKADNMLVFQGCAQGQYKSSFPEALVPVVDWYGDPHIDMGNVKDAVLAIREPWLCEVAEIDQQSFFTKYSDWKKWITTKVDRIRAPYTPAPKKYPRTGVFFGTTNARQFLTDPTGHRRFWVIPIKTRIRWELLAAVRTQIWAQAKAGYDATKGQEYRWWLTPEEELRCAVDSAVFEIEDPKVDIVAVWLSQQKDRFVASTVIMKECGIEHASTLAKIMQRLKWDYTRGAGPGGVRVRGYAAPEDWQPSGLRVVSPDAPAAEVMDLVSGILAD